MSDTAYDIAVDRLAREQSDGATVVDVREPGDCVTGQVPGATSIPMAQPSSRLVELDKSRPCISSVRSGNRIAAMTDLLCAAGHDAYSVADGPSAWARSGRPVETGAPRPG